MPAYYQGEEDKARQDPNYVPREARLGDLVTGRAHGLAHPITGRVVEVDEAADVKRQGNLRVAHVDRASTIYRTETGQLCVHASLAGGDAAEFVLVN